MKLSVLQFTSIVYVHMHVLREVGFLCADLHALHVCSEESYFFQCSAGCGCFDQAGHQ